MTDVADQARHMHSPTPVNKTLFQAFEWHTPGPHWTRLAKYLPQLTDLGITSIWLPPGCKANSPQGNGYDCYDLWDLGEFDQKWTRPTKWGSKEELLRLISSAHALNVTVIWDAVLNHKTAGDATEPCWAVEVDPTDRRIETTKPREIEPWIHYNFPGRGDTYSSLKWHWQHFNGTDWDQRGQQHGIFKIINPPSPDDKMRLSQSRRSKDWALDVDDENGNGDYLMFSNIDYTNLEVREDVLRWGQWMVQDVGDGIDGFRLDAVQHYSQAFTIQWIERVQAAGRQRGKDIDVIGEFWQPDCRKLIAWVDFMKQQAMLFDVPLLNNFGQLKRLPPQSRWSRFRRPIRPPFDMRLIFEGTLTQYRPNNAVTVVANHDTQPGQAMDTPIEPLFTTHAYALILLTARGTPCVFYGDLYGIGGPAPRGPSCRGKLPSLIMARKLYAYGKEHLTFPNSRTLALIRQGTRDKPDGCVMIMTIGEGTTARLPVGGQEKAGSVWTDLLCNSPQEVKIDRQGYGEFTCPAEGCCVFVRKDAEGREKFPPPCSINIYE
ncbi:glucan 1,4-alpha-maltohexaosidase precursor [Elsinoe ampelina]|uniref:Glucan 1,4-alpha-maltohexaosidase n=1 Tax=Elsinoe ampelina TaxID=302913 RepID=A0A6A6GA23_9PEZI|nr:glucan 1,4-alpha-maltohexaosidase precursor [Elsinoe ampelina]